MAGYTILVETDNMAAKGSAAKRSSRAADMQELIRRLVRMCETHDIRLRLTHTPGLKLDRPDQISRGDPVEEPRQRWTREVFAALEAAWGPFDSFIGPERHLAERSAIDGALEREGVEAAWVHPAHSSVGAALRRLHDSSVPPCACRRAGDSAGWRWYLTIPRRRGSRSPIT